MKLTKSKLKQIIKEELRNILSEEGKTCHDATDCAEGQECKLGNCEDLVHAKRSPYSERPEATPKKRKVDPQKERAANCRVKFNPDDDPKSYEACLKEK